MEEMRERIVAAAKRHRQAACELLRQLIAIPSESQHEEIIAQAVRRHMQLLGYDAANVDRFGNVIGRIGNGPTHIVFDAHMDTCGIGDRASWRFDPYQGEFKGGKIYGHGATNNKSGLAAIIYAGKIIKELDLASECTVHVVGSIQMEACEGLAYRAILDVEKLQPNYIVLSMPTGMRICRGHRGRAEIGITLRGQAVHASDPSKGINAIYEISEIVRGIKQLNDTLPEDPLLGKATIAVTHIDSTSHSSRQLPELCRITIDRRLTPQDDEKKILKEIQTICRGTRAKIEIVEHDAPTYRGLRLPMAKFFPAWSLQEEHPLLIATEDAFRTIQRKKPVIGCWAMSTPGAYTMGMNKIPTIGFGPAEETAAGPINDHVRIDDLERAMAIYASIPDNLPPPGSLNELLNN